MTNLSTGATHDWSEYQRLVLFELQRLSESAESHTTKLSKIATDIALLKLKSGIWGFAAGAIPAACVAIWRVMSK